MIVLATSDLHGYPLHKAVSEQGDILILAGDLTRFDTEKEWDDLWRQLEYRNEEIIICPGNHDNFLQDNPDFFDVCEKIHMPIDKTIEVLGLKIHCMPWTVKFWGQHPNAMAYTVGHENDMLEYVKEIPSGLDFLVTHGPPRYILDQNEMGDNCGSATLMHHMITNDKPIAKFHIFGHIHEQAGKIFNHCSPIGEKTKIENNMTTFVNVSAVDKYYELKDDHNRKIVYKNNHENTV